MKIRKATLKDFKKIIALNQKLFDYEYENFDKTLDCNWPSKNEKYFKNSITDKNSFALVAIENNKIIGYFIGNIKKVANYRNIKKIAEGGNAYILPDYQRKAIGTQFYQKFLRWSKNKGVNRIKAIVSAKNRQSINWHKKIGFVEHDLVLEMDLK